MWGNPEIRTEGESALALTQLQLLGVPDPQLWADWGYSPQEIERFRAMQRANALDAESLGLTAVVASPAPPPVPVPPAPEGEGPESEPGEPSADDAAGDT